MLASELPLPCGDLDADPRVVTWLGLPGAVDRLDASRICEQLRVCQPDLNRPS